MSYVVDGPVVFPLMPNWKNGIKEILEWKTNVIGPTLTGMRQKRCMRSYPRRFFEFDVLPHMDSLQLFENILFSQGKREWQLPLWHDVQRTTTPITVGASSIPTQPTSTYDFTEYALLHNGDLVKPQFEMVSIDAVQAAALDLSENTVNAWPVGSWLFPLVPAVLRTFPRLDVRTSRVATTRALFEVTNVSSWAENTFSTTYRDRPVWEYTHDWRVSRALSFDRLISSIDNQTSTPDYFDLPDQTFGMLDSIWMCYDRADHNLLRTLLYGLRGRYRSVWVPSMKPDLNVLANIGSASTTISVAYCGYTVFGKNKEGRKDIRIETVSGVVYYRRITNSVEAGATETLTISSALGANINAADILRVSFMALSQLVSDSVDLDHITDANGATAAMLAFEGVVEPPADP